MTPTVTVIVYPVTDLDAAKASFTALLGSGPDVDTPYYVQYQAGDVVVGLDPHRHAQFGGPVPYFQVENIEAVIKALTDAGGTLTRPASDVGAGLLVAVVTDTQGNPIGLQRPSTG